VALGAVGGAKTGAFEGKGGGVGAEAATAEGGGRKMK
jgi:hypothetical protein